MLPVVGCVVGGFFEVRGCPGAWLAVAGGFELGTRLGYFLDFWFSTRVLSVAFSSRRILSSFMTASWVSLAIFSARSPCKLETKARTGRAMA